VLERESEREGEAEEERENSVGKKSRGVWGR